jgi:hypothetical protein
MNTNNQSTWPGAIIGYRKNGTPIRLIARGAPDGDTDGAADGQGATWRADQCTAATGFRAHNATRAPDSLRSAQGVDSAPGNVVSAGMCAGLPTF